MSHFNKAKIFKAYFSLLIFLLFIFLSGNRPIHAVFGGHALQDKIAGEPDNKPKRCVFPFMDVRPNVAQHVQDNIKDVMVGQSLGIASFMTWKPHDGQQQPSFKKPARFAPAPLPPDLIMPAPLPINYSVNDALRTEVADVYEENKAALPIKDPNTLAAALKKLVQLDEKLVTHFVVEENLLSNEMIPLNDYIKKYEDIFGDEALPLSSLEVRKTLKHYNELNLWLLVHINTLMLNEAKADKNISRQPVKAAQSKELKKLNAMLLSLYEEEKSVKETYIKAPSINFNSMLLDPLKYVLKDEDINDDESCIWEVRQKLMQANHLTLNLLAHLNVMNQKESLSKLTLAFLAQKPKKKVTFASNTPQ